MKNRSNSFANREHILTLSSDRTEILAGKMHFTVEDEILSYNFICCGIKSNPEKADKVPSHHPSVQSPRIVSKRLAELSWYSGFSRDQKNDSCRTVH